MLDMCRLVDQIIPPDVRKTSGTQCAFMEGKLDSFLPMGDECLGWVVKYPTMLTAMEKLIEYITNHLYVRTPL